ncbi:MAG: ChaN family lipoprotein [Bdellovibrionales bacterium]|nr:ChaN family lipoprotein [Bdellovibrionales bacterium]
MKARSRLLQLQKGIYGSLKLEAARLVGALPQSIQRYEKSYLSSFRASARRPRVSSRQALTERMRSADVTFVADYHTLGQAQRTALRLVQDVYRAGEKWVIGLEFVPSHRQAELDAYQAGLMDAATFLQKIRYREDWGFPWENYAPLLDWARRTGVQMLALNRPRELPFWKERVTDGDDLLARDLWAAGVITDLFSSLDPRAMRPKVVVLYGELHVGGAHLPANLERISSETLGDPLDWVSVHQNNDSLYWKLARRGMEHRNDVLRLDHRNFHVISSTPWNKLQSLVSWAEGIGTESERFPATGALRLAHADSSIMSNADNDEDEFLCDLESESLSKIQAYGDAMANFLKLPAPEFERLSLQSVYSADFVDGLSDERRLSTLEQRLIRELVLRNCRFFVPRTGLLYLGTPSANGAAELAAIILAKGHSARASFFGETQDSFFQAVMDQAFGFFGSLLVNPRRKCDLPEDHLQRYLTLKSTQGADWVESQARLYTLVGLEEQARFLGRTRKLEARSYVRRLNAPIMGMAAVSEQALSVTGPSSVHVRIALWLCSRYLGKILGKLLHGAVLQGDVSIEQVRELAWQATDRRWRPAEIRYWEWVAAVAAQPLPVSKRQTI